MGECTYIIKNTCKWRKIYILALHAKLLGKEITFPNPWSLALLRQKDQHLDPGGS